MPWAHPPRKLRQWLPNATLGQTSDLAKRPLFYHYSLYFRHFMPLDLSVFVFLLILFLFHYRSFFLVRPLLVVPIVLLLVCWFLFRPWQHLKGGRARHLGQYGPAWRLGGFVWAPLVVFLGIMLDPLSESLRVFSVFLTFHWGPWARYSMTVGIWAFPV